MFIDFKSVLGHALKTSFWNNFCRTGFWCQKLLTPQISSPAWNFLSSIYLPYSHTSHGLFSGTEWIASIHLVRSLLAKNKKENHNDSQSFCHIRNGKFTWMGKMKNLIIVQSKRKCWIEILKWNFHRKKLQVPVMLN